MTFQFRFIPVLVGVNEHFQHNLCNYWVKDAPNSFLAIDNIETGIGEKIPL